MRAHAGWLFRCALLLTGRHHSAEDLAQDTLVKVWIGWAKVKAADDPDSYVARIMLNTFRSSLRPRTLTLVDSVEAELTPVLDDTGTVDDADAVLRSMSSLTPRQRGVVVLRYWADWDDKAIASALDCRQSTVRSLASRAVKTMRQELGGHYG